MTTWLISLSNFKFGNNHIHKSHKLSFLEIFIYRIDVTSWWLQQLATLTASQWTAYKKINSETYENNCINQEMNFFFQIISILLHEINFTRHRKICICTMELALELSSWLPWKSYAVFRSYFPMYIFFNAIFWGKKTATNSKLNPIVNNFSFFFLIISWLISG